MTSIPDARRIKIPIFPTDTDVGGQFRPDS